MIRVFILTITAILLVNDSYAQNGCMLIRCTATSECVNCPALIPECRPSCDNPRGGSRLDRRCRARGCQAACVCRSGYVRNDDGNCVLERDCPNTAQDFLDWLRQLWESISGSGNSNGGSTGGGGSQLVCGSNQQVNQCGNRCEPQCADPGRMCIQSCQDSPACQCIAGFARDNNNRCVNATSSECQALSTGTDNGGVTTGSQLVCGSNQQLNECGNRCDSQCANPDRACIFICDSPACACSPGFARDNNGNCVNESSAACLALNTAG